MLIVAVSADRRYGLIYNQGIAQVIYNGLRQRGYEPVNTLIGYSGGGQMSVASAPYLSPAILAPIDAISLGGVRIAHLEHLYHIGTEPNAKVKLV